jgi:hypothetical protein
MTKCTDFNVVMSTARSPVARMRPSTLQSSSDQARLSTAERVAAFIIAALTAARRDAVCPVLAGPVVALQSIVLLSSIDARLRP